MSTPETLTPEEAARGRFEACKRYLRVDIADDDEIITALLAAADGYLRGAGIDRATDPAQYDLVAYALTLQMYDERDADTPQQAATAPLVRQMLTQLKLRSAYGGEVPNGTGG